MASNGLLVTKKKFDEIVFVRNKNFASLVLRQSFKKIFSPTEEAAIFRLILCTHSYFV